jgi:anthranilate phosphoribosyltransferase
VLDSFIAQLNRSIALTAPQVQEAVGALADETLNPKIKADFLTALAKKGETTEEIAAFAQILRDKSIQPALDPTLRAGEIIDVCGTGGDRLRTFNISTTVAFVVAAADVAVAKHGNRAITSQSGSADVLEALGIRIDLSPDQSARMLKDHKFAFFFAPRYHPAFKHIAPARQLCAAQGQRTIFNFLGPLLNPTRPTAQLVGVPHPYLCEPLARVLQSLGLRRAMVACGAVPGTGPGQTAYLDELSTLGETTAATFSEKHSCQISQLSLHGLNLSPATLGQLRGADGPTNAALIRRLLSGEESGPRREAVLLNAGAALLVAGVAGTLEEGWARAAGLIDSGRANTKLAEIIHASAAF